jgi:PAS domain S-box-containing protein
VLGVAVATLLRALLDPFLGEHYPLGTFYAVVILVGWLLGVGPAIVAAVLGYILGELLFLSPRGSPLGWQFHVLELSAYTAICTTLIALVYRVFERQRQLDSALRAQAEVTRALAAQDARFKQYLDAMPDIIYTWSADGTLDYVSPRWTDYTGNQPLTLQEMEARLPDPDRQQLVERREQALRHGSALRSEFRLRDRDGNLRWFLTRCVPIRDAGAIRGWVGSSIDVDDEKRALEALEFSERRHRTFSEAFDLGTWSADAGGRLTFASARLLQFLGASLEDAQQKAWSAVLAPQRDIERAAARWRRSVESGEIWDWECSLQGADGIVRRVWSRGIPLRGADGQISAWTGFSLDVTQRYAAEAARDQARENLELVTNLMPVGVAQCNRQLEFVWANPAYAKQLGLTPEQIQGRRIEELLGRESFERLRPFFARVLAGEAVQYEGAETVNALPNRWIHAAYTPIWDGHPLPSGWVAVVSDLTERRALEEQLRNSNRQKDQFLATLAHELRNPLAPIRYATRLLRPGVPAGMATDASRMIDRQLGHMARLLDDLLDVSRITRGILEIRQDTLDLRATLQQAVDTSRPLADAVQHNLRLELPANPLPVRGDETRLIQVLGNLINNAIKYTAAGGQISVTASDTASKVVVAVRDSGSGIAADLLPHIFEMFTQGQRGSRSQTGLGIGLALARQIVELHGGSIEAHSEGPGRGSEFRVLLPMVQEVPAVLDTRTEPTNVSVLGADSLRVLIVDDNVDAADTLAHLLKVAGYQTRVAYDGRTAIEMAEILQPNVVLLDLGLPYLSGREVAQRLRALPWGRSTSLIAITGWGQEGDVRRSLESGFDEHLTKPIDPDVLLRLMARLTRSSGPGQRNSGHATS